MSARIHCLDPDVVAVVRKPPVAGALRIYEPSRRKMDWPLPLDATRQVTALACIHMTRLRWDGSTKAMVRESNAWLIEHGMSPDAAAAPNLTIQ